MNRSNVFVILFCIFPACTQKKHIKKVTFPATCIQHHTPKPASPPITIWVHGTRFIRRPLFYTYFDGIPSIRPVQEIDPESTIFENAHTLHATAPDQFPLETFYVFGWSGKLRSTIRQEAANYLYAEIQRILKNYKEKHTKTPQIRLITHSHGGTVALNLAQIKRKSNDEPFTIKELVLMGCPVQRATKEYIESDLFEHTCALYSGLDMVQILAPQITYTFYKTKKGNVRSRFHWPPFSKRRFQKHPKLAQVKVKINGRALFHSEFTSNRFIAILPHILHVLNSCHRRQQEFDTQLLCVYTRDDD